MKKSSTILTGPPTYNSERKTHCVGNLREIFSPETDNTRLYTAKDPLLIPRLQHQLTKQLKQNQDGFSIFKSS